MSPGCCKITSPRIPVQRPPSPSPNHGLSEVLLYSIHPSQLRSSSSSPFIWS
ncbi:hypothetical protein L9F63_001050, partial [Diploptera punctata]